jgi:predicted Zn-dependent protease
VLAAILTQRPEPLEQVRPEVPPELARVVERALAKNPADRYVSATELASDLESGRMPAGRLTQKRRTKSLGVIAGVLVVLLILVSVFIWRPWTRVVGPPLRVAILRPVVELEGNHPEPAFIASDVMNAALAALITLEGVQPLDLPEKGEEKEIEAQRLREADEALLPQLKCRDDSCQVTLQRRKPDRRIIKVSDPFEVQGGFENAYPLLEGVRVHVQQVYSAHLRPSSAASLVKAEDYSAYFELQRRVDRGERLGSAELMELDSLVQTSPGLVGAYVLAAGIARNQGEWGRALEYTTRAENAAPYDPRPLLICVRIEVKEARFNAARKTLDRLAAMMPGDPRVKGVEADLFEGLGELEKAYKLRKELAEQRPTWRNILKLATLEFRMGASKDALRRLNNLLAEQPDNQYVWEGVAALEATSGDLKRAAALYERLNQRWPARAYLTNLGFVRYLLGDHVASIAASKQALELEPKDLQTRFNLAIALEAQGNQVAARQIYRALVKELAAAPPTQEVHDRLLQAQCLVRLNQKDVASHLADAVLKVRPEDIQNLYLAAQMYALLGDPAQAQYYKKLAIGKGLLSSWFNSAEFRLLGARTGS